MSSLTATALSPWHKKQVQGSARMLERIIGDDLRRGDTAQLRKRLIRVEEILGREILKAQDAAPLQLLAARLADTAGDARQTDLFVGRILAAEWLLRGDLKAAVDRFCARVHLNRGEIADARLIVDRIERMVTLIPTGRGSQHEEIIDTGDEQVSVSTWLLSAEVSLAEQDLERARADLGRARAAFASALPSPDEAAMFDLLTSLLNSRFDDAAAAAALAHLYRVYVRGECSDTAPKVEAQTAARIAAACGRLDEAVGINHLEAERWSEYGAACAKALEFCFAAPPPGPDSAELPEPELLIELLEGALRPARVETRATSAQIELSEFPLDVSLAHTRLDSITSMLDLDRDTGILEVDWSRCDPAHLAEAAASGAINEFATRVLRGTIYFNDGAYVDACLETDDPALHLLPPAEVIFELFRIALARLPLSRARQILDNPAAPRTPERINQRPNKFNLEISARIDHLRGDADDDPAPELSDFDFAVWSPPIEPRADGEREQVQLAPAIETASSRLLTHLAAIFAAHTLAGICSSVRLAATEMGTGDVVVVVTTSGSETAQAPPLASSGTATHQVSTWSSQEAGPLLIRLGLVNAAPTALQQQGLITILEAAAHRLRALPASDDHGHVELSNFIAADARTQKMLRLVREFAELDGVTPGRKLRHIMIVGERGVGKELVAQALHRWSGRAGKSFCAVNMGRISRELAPAEIFGASRGGYTGATTDRRGLVQQFDGGTLFLDEIDEADDKVQAMLKRVVEYGTYERVGDPTELRADIRFIVATNRLAGDTPLIKEDLRDRFWEIRIAPLRERRADIRPLAEHFARLHSYVLPEPILAWLESPAFRWPGNVRQLQNAVERACALARRPSDLTLDLFQQCVSDSGGTKPPAADANASSLAEGETLETRLKKVERLLIQRALDETGGNKTQAAERLGGTRQWLYKRCHVLGIKTN